MIFDALEVLNKHTFLVLIFDFCFILSQLLFLFSFFWCAKIHFGGDVQMRW